MKVPSRGFLATVRVRIAVAAVPLGTTVVGVIVAVTPVGRPEIVRLTGSENPFSPATVVVTFVDWGESNVSEVVESASEKSITRTVNLAVCTVGPLTPVMVKSKVPAVAALVVVMVNRTSVVAPGLRNAEVGVTDTEIPSGAPVT